MACQIDQIDNSIYLLTNEYIKLLDDWQKCLDNFSIIFENIKQFENLLKHIHAAHKHELFPIHVSSILSGFGISGGCPNENAITRLMRELSAQMDYDGNNKQYGEFLINPKDLNIPRGIKDVQTQYEIRFGILESDIYLTMSELFKELKKEERELPIDPEQKLILQLILGENPDNPNSQYSSNLQNTNDSNISDKKLKPGWDKVYGKDFLINPIDPNKPKKLQELEKNLTFSDDIQLISYNQYLEKYLDPELKEKTSGSISIKKEKSADPDLCNYVCSRLVGEWLHGTDLDKNGLIYGQDFYLINCPEKCYCLNEIENDLQWNDKNLKGFSWNDYCNTFPNQNPDDRYN